MVKNGEIAKWVLVMCLTCFLCGRKRTEWNFFKKCFLSSAPKGGLGRGGDPWGRGRGWGVQMSPGTLARPIWTLLAKVVANTLQTVWNTDAKLPSKPPSKPLRDGDRHTPSNPSKLQVWRPFLFLDVTCAIATFGPSEHEKLRLLKLSKDMCLIA